MFNPKYDLSAVNILIAIMAISSRNGVVPNPAVRRVIEKTY